MSAVMGALSGSKDIPLDHPNMEKEKEEEKKEKREEEDGENDDDDEDEIVALGPQVPLKEQLEKDKDDESLRRWKEQLLGSVDVTSVGETSEPEVKITSLTIITPDRPDMVIPVPFVPNSKGYAFTLKDGSRYRLKFTFNVSNNIVSGLRYTNTVWKTGVKVENTKVMLGTFSPQQEPYTYELEEETTPSGLFARGSYSAKTKKESSFSGQPYWIGRSQPSINLRQWILFVDDDGKCYLDISYFFEIRKDWPT